MHTITKQYRDLPAAHRQAKHDGHCRLIHGHNFGFDITLAADFLDPNGFVLDVGKMQNVKDMLNKLFDHTLLVNADDPMILPGSPLANLCDFSNVKVVPNCGMEGLAELVFKEVGRLLLDRNFADTCARNVVVVSVTCWEDSKNSATYRP